jgi:predicted AAA+ superfamily ATPase
MFQRVYLRQLSKRINEPRKFIQVIMGPRQVGKRRLLANWLKRLMNHSITQNFYN